MQDLEFVLASLLAAARALAVRLPTPSNPPEMRWSDDADAYLRFSAQEEVFRKMTPEIASALIPRISYAHSHLQTIATDLNHEFLQVASPGEVLLELLLIRWHSTFRANWLCSKDKCELVETGVTVEADKIVDQ